MYKLNKILFGWDYIQWENTCSSGIARVFKLPNGKVVFWQYKMTRVMVEIKEPNQVNWLTCHPSKFSNKVG